MNIVKEFRTKSFLMCFDIRDNSNKSTSCHFDLDAVLVCIYSSLSNKRALWN